MSPEIFSILTLFSLSFVTSNPRKRNGGVAVVPDQGWAHAAKYSRNGGVPWADQGWAQAEERRLSARASSFRSWGISGQCSSGTRKDAAPWPCAGCAFCFAS